MQKLFSVGAVFLMITLFLDNGYSLNCYQCRSDTDKGCSAPFDQNLSKPCTAKSNVRCRKIHEKLKFKGEESFTSIRECAYHTEKSPGCYIFKWYKLANMETCECTEDDCNRGSRHHIPNIIPVAFSLLWIFIYVKSNYI